MPCKPNSAMLSLSDWGKRECKEQQQWGANHEAHTLCVISPPHHHNLLHGVNDEFVRVPMPEYPLMTSFPIKIMSAE